MESVRKEHHNGKEILILDYSNLNVAGMIEAFNLAKSVVVKDGKPVLLLNIFNHKNFVTGKFVRHVERELRDVEYLLEKNAIVGLSEIQKWILKGINLWYKKQIHSFASVEKALEFLITDAPMIADKSGQGTDHVRKV